MNVEKLLLQRKHRLLQVFFLTEAVLIIQVFHRLMVDAENAYLLSFQLLLSVVALSPVYFLAKKNKIGWATQWLIVGLTLLLTALIWHYGGLTDEALFGYPCILVFAALMGLKRTFILLLSFMISNILLIGLMNDLHLIQHVSIASGIHSGLVLSLILMLFGFSIWLLLGDLNKLLYALHAENFKVHKSQQQIQQLINHDALTHLPNRIVARELFEVAQQNCRMPDGLVALMFIDLDNFKDVNDNLGHHAGDKLLQEVAHQLRQQLRNSDSVCRISGDEFLVLLQGCRSQAEVAVLADKLLQAVSTPVQLETTEIFSTCSIGVALFPHDADNFDLLCQKADMAMYKAKENGRNSYCFFDTSMSQQTEQTFNLLNDLKNALAEQQFELYYQPQYDLRTGQVCAAEALLRWHHPAKGLVSPAVFIPLAEQYGLMPDLGRWVLQQACKDCMFWNTDKTTPIRVTVNVSQTQLNKKVLEQDVQDALHISQLSGHLLELELTESMLVENAYQLDSTIRKLKTHGVHFSIDDFGTGYSNLAYLKDFELQILKIDQSFIYKALDDHRSKAVVTAIIQLARSLDMHCVAEGIENKQTLELLTALGCEKGQGYYWVRPEPFEQFMARLAHN